MLFFHYSFSFYAQIQTPWQECDSTTQAFQVLVAVLLMILLDDLEEVG